MTIIFINPINNTNHIKFIISLTFPHILFFIILIIFTIKFIPIFPSLLFLSIIIPVFFIIILILITFIFLILNLNLKFTDLLYFNYWNFL